MASRLTEEVWSHTIRQPPPERRQVSEPVARKPVPVPSSATSHAMKTNRLAQALHPGFTEVDNLVRMTFLDPAGHDAPDSELIGQAFDLLSSGVDYPAAPSATAAGEG